MCLWSGGRVVLLSKKTRFCEDAWAIARLAFGPALEIHAGEVGDPMPDLSEGEPPAYLVSFLSPWIVPKADLDRSGCSINFHPGPAEYPGSGCYNFALYEGAEEYGAVCHVMLEKVDTGRIIAERRFAMGPSDSVESLKLRTMRVMLELFDDIVGLVLRGEPLPVSERQWTRAPFRLREMDRLRLISPAMSEEEVRRRVRATTYPGYPGPILKHRDGRLFHYPVPERAPLA